MLLESTLVSYLAIQKLRFVDKFESYFKISEDIDTDQIFILPLILQPIVENAILHGFEGVSRTHVLNVEMRREEDTICIKIEDNGCGMTEDMVWEVNHGIFGNAESKRHIGMENAITRIRIYYGEKAVVRIESEADQGTRVNICIPL